MKLLTISFLLAVQLGAESFSLQTVEGLKPNGVKVEAVTYKGKQAVRVTQESVQSGDQSTETTIAIVSGTDFQDGVIELEVSGDVGPGATPQARGLPVWHSGLHPTSNVSSVSTCVPPTAAPRTRLGAITLPSTCLCQGFRGSSYARSSLKVRILRGPRTRRMDKGED